MCDTILVVSHNQSQRYLLTPQTTYKDEYHHN